jgi:hypothetical protein
MSKQYRHPRGGNNRNPDSKIDLPRGQTGSREIREPDNPDDEGRVPNEPVREDEKKE